MEQKSELSQASALSTKPYVCQTGGSSDACVCPAGTPSHHCPFYMAKVEARVKDQRAKAGTI